MNKRKAGIGMFGIIVIGLCILAIVYIAGSVPWLVKMFKIKNEVNVFVNVNDETSDMASLLSAKTDQGTYSDVFSCMISGLNGCGDDDEIERVVGLMDTELVLYSDLKEVRTYGSKNVGSRIYADIPLPNGKRGEISLLLEAGVSLTGSVDDSLTELFGDCKKEGDAAYIRNHLVYIKDFRGKDIPVHKVAERDFKKVLSYLNDIDKCPEAQDYNLWEDPSGNYTYSCRANVNNPTKMSMHSYGLAIDINPSSNPNCPKDCDGKNVLITDIPDCVVDAFRSNNFRWGGSDFRSVKDSMHFEWIVPSDGEALEDILEDLNYLNKGVTD